MLRSSPRPLAPRSVPCTALTYPPPLLQTSLSPHVIGNPAQDFPRYPIHTVQARGLSLLRTPASFASTGSPTSVDSASPDSAYSSSTFGTPNRALSYDPSELFLSSSNTPSGSPTLSLVSDAQSDVVGNFRQRQLFFSPSPSGSPSTSPGKRSNMPRNARRKAVNRLKMMADLGPTSSPELQPSHTSARVAKSRASRSRKSKGGTGNTSLPGPLSIITNGSKTPIKDTASFVSRPIEQRHVEAMHKGKIARAMNCFILYRRAFCDRASEYCEQNSQPYVSDLLGKSWRMETDNIKRQFQRWADEEAAGHKAAFPEYSYRPSNSNRVTADDLLGVCEVAKGPSVENLPTHSPLIKSEAPMTPPQATMDHNRTTSGDHIDAYPLDSGIMFPDRPPMAAHPEQIQFSSSPEFYSDPSSFYGDCSNYASSPLAAYGVQPLSMYGGSDAYSDTYEPGEPLPSSSAWYFEQPRTRFWRDADELARYDEQVGQASAGHAAGDVDNRGCYIGNVVGSSGLSGFGQPVQASAKSEQNDAMLFDEFCRF